MTKQKKHPYKPLLRGSDKTSAIKRHYPVSAGYLLLAHLLTGCDFSEGEPPHVIDKPDVNNTRTKAPETPPKSIDLTISPEMMETLQHQEEEAFTQTETPSALFTNPSKEKDVSFSGKLHMDEDEDKEYLDSVDGAEVNIKVKFE